MLEVILGVLNDQRHMVKQYLIIYIKNCPPPQALYTMQDYYIRIRDDLPAPTPPRLLLAAYLCQAVLYGLITAYCVVWPSLFSAINLLFMLVSLALSVATPYYVIRTNESSQSLRVVAYPAERVTFVLFVLFNVAVFVLKSVLYYSVDLGSYSEQQLEFYQLESTLQVFLPLVMWPFAAVAATIRTKSREFSHFQTQVNKLVAAPVFLVLGILILLIQIFSPSVVGFIFFICIMVLFVQRRIDFDSRVSWLFVLAVHLLTIAFIAANFLTTTALIQSYQHDNAYSFYGLNGLSDFMRSETARGYFICLVILFLVSCSVQRIFAYNRIWRIVSKITPPTLDNHTNELAEQGAADSSRRFSHFEQVQQSPRLLKRGSNYSLQQIELPSVKGRPRRPETAPAAEEEVEEAKSERTQLNSPPESKNPKKEIYKAMGDALLQAIEGLLRFIYSSQFSLRFCEVISIVVIQRYNNIYSFVAVIWLTMVASTERVRLIYYVTAFVLLPVEIGNFVITYAYNAAQSPLASLTGLENYGFQTLQLYYLDIIIFNIYFFYLITFLWSVRHSGQQVPAPKKAADPSLWVLACAFLFRYTYLLTLAAMFFLGFSHVTLINLVYVIMFLVFFSSGQNVLLEEKKRNSRTILSLTTFSRKFWFIIVYYTLACIIAKYCYFLFFEDKLSTQLAPSGVSEVYSWSFNFSLSSTCKSNTTPFFIIFILAEAQIMIYRSSIYLNYSFSLISQISSSKSPRRSRLRGVFNSLLEMVLEFYYQSLYLVSGVVILVCSYTWNMLSLAIVAATCFGLLRQFNKPILAFIVFMDLANIILTYAIQFLEYDYVQQLIGPGGVDIINKIALLIGLLTERVYDLAGAFALKIVIFYFGVESYGLKKKLDENRFNDEGIFEEAAQGNEDEPEQTKNQDDTISRYEPTVIESEIKEKQFGKNFNKNVILRTKKLYETVLWQKYSWWGRTCHVLSMFLTDLVTVFILVSCLVFRLSVSMLFFLLIYMAYYFLLFDRIGTLMANQDLYGRIQRQFSSYKGKQQTICDRDGNGSLVDGSQSTQSLIAFIASTKEKATRLKREERRTVWLFSSISACLFVLLTYTAQFFTSRFYEQVLQPPKQFTNTLEDILFVLGISVTEQTSFFRQVYFYFFLLLLMAVEKMLLMYNEQVDAQLAVSEIKPALSKSQYMQLEDPINFVDEKCDFIAEVDIKDEQALSGIVMGGQQRQGEDDQQRQGEDDQQADYSKQSNLLIYFDYKRCLIKINYLYGLLMLLLRLYLLMMLVNLYEKSNVFAFAYLFSVLFFWFQPLQFGMVKDINKIAIAILLLQYIVLLLDINASTSALPQPNPAENLSILRMLIKNQEWINYLVVDFGKASTGSFMVSFLISSVIIFLTELYFSLFFWISRLSVAMIRGVYSRYEYIADNLARMPSGDTVYLNYENYKDWSYRFMKVSYELLINNSYIVVSYLILILLSTIHNFLSVGLVLFACVYIYLGIFTGFSEDKNIYQYTTAFFRAIQAILFLVLIMITLAEIPVFPQNNSVVAYIEDLSNLEQVFLLFLIQIWLDLSVSQEFRQATRQFNDMVRNRENVMIKCIAYQENKDLISRMLHRYKEVMWFEVNLKDALDIIDEWHKAMYKKKTPEFENLKTSKMPSHVQSLKEEIKREQEKRPEEDESITDKVLEFMEDKTSVALKYRYYEIMKYIVFNNHRLINIEHASVDIWDYVLEDYHKLSDQVAEADARLQELVKAVQAEDVGDRMDLLEQIKKDNFEEEAGNVNQLLMGLIKTPPKIFIDIKMPKDSVYKTVVFFVLSNFSYFLSFFTWVYYLINPCLLSLPFIVYFFSYQLISFHKLTSLMLIYIFSIIILALWVQIEAAYASDWVKYLFFMDDDGQYQFSIGYLLFLFILIFINEEIRKYQGNKFKEYHEAENKMQGAFRILINEDKRSPFYLWNFKTEDDYEEKECNPMNYFAEKIEYHPEDLTHCDMLGFFQGFDQGKTGIDLYPLIASVQIFLTIYLIFLYPLMVQSESSSIQESFKYFQFSSNMVIALLCHVMSIIVERRITLIRPQNKLKSKIKYWYTMFILGLVLVFIYFIAPSNKQVKGAYQPSGALVAFAFFYFFYFFLSALQIRFGYKKYKSLNSTLTKRRQFNNLILIVFTAVPFLYELKLMMDYSFCQTSLQLFDWFRLFSIYYAAFKAKMQYYSATGIKLGSSQPWPLKIIGWLGFIGILIVIFGPMILFSGLNPIAQPNLVIGGALKLGIQIENGNYFNLYSTQHFSSPPFTYTAQEFYEQGFGVIPALSFLTSSDIPNQFQLVQFEPYSDVNWGISSPNFEMLLLSLQNTISQLKQGLQPTNNFSIVVDYALDRRVTETLSTDTNFMYPFSNSLNLTQLESLYTTFTVCDTPTYLSEFYISLIRLYTIGSSYKPRPIVYTNPSGVDPYLEGVYLTLFCNGVNSTQETNNVYWALISTNSSSPDPLEPTGSGVFLYVLCDKYQNLIGGLGFTALYTSVILVIAGFIRGAFEGNLPQIPYFQNPKPDNIIQISEAIGTLRDRKQFREEYLMYYELIDIIRSPDLMKFLSGSYPGIIEQADEKRRKKEEDREILSRRDKIE